MGNVFGVWSVSVGLWLAVWGMFGSVRGASAAAGLLLCVAAAAVLVDVGGDT